MRFFFILILTLSANALFAQETLFCSIKGRKSDLVVQNENFKIADFDFSSSSYLPSYYNCLSFLDQASLDDSPEFTPLLSMNEKSKMARLQGNTKSLLHKTCLETRGCKINFPYNLLSLSGLKQIFQKPTLKKYSINCSNPPVLNLKEDSTLPKEINSKKVYWWKQPASTMANELLKKLIEKTPTQIIISTMSLSRSEIVTINEYLIDNPKAKAFVFYAFGLATFDSDFPEWTDYLSPRLFLIPIFTTPSTPSSYHLKGISWKNKNESGLIFNSSNLKDYNHKSLIDLGFTSSDTNLVNDFNNQVFYLSKSVCERPQIFDCHVEQRYNSAIASKNILRKKFAQSCQNIPEAIFDKDSSMKRGPLRATIKQYIKQAKSKVTIITHALNDREIISLLEEMISQGIKVKIYLGQKLGSDSRALAKLRSSIQVSRTAEVHSKIIVIDEKSFVLSSANLTSSALSNPYENLYYFTDSQEVLKYLEEIKDNY